MTADFMGGIREPKWS